MLSTNTEKGMSKSVGFNEKQAYIIALSEKSYREIVGVNIDSSLSENAS